MPLKATIVPNTRPAVWLSVPVRLAIRDFARAHDHHQVLTLEEMVADGAIEFHAIHGCDPWFSALPAHTFDAIEVAGEHPHHPIDRLVLIIKAGPGGTAAMLCVHTPDEHPLGDDYHVARVIHESAYIDTTSR